MFQNYLRVGIRNILKYKVFSFINVFGLAVAMSVCLLMILMLADQHSYDRFHAHREDIYRILAEPREARQPYATTPFPLAGTLAADYPAIGEATHLVAGVGGDGRYGGKIAEMRGFFADTSFFRVFGFGLEKGSRRHAFRQPNSIVVTQEIARQLFGDENPLGKTIQFTDRGLHYLESGTDSPPVAWGNYTVTGVLADQNYKSHLKFNVLVSAASLPALYQGEKRPDLTASWEEHHQTWTYVRLAPGKTGRDLTLALNGVVKNKYAHRKDFGGFRLMGQPLGEINTHLLNNEMTYRLPVMVYYFLGILAAVIMFSACLNYTNLSIARALTRAKEIGVRKVAGASRQNLVLQFLSESVVTALLALVMAILLLLFIKPAFRGLWVNQFLNFELRDNLYVYLGFAVFALLIGLVAGLYPALHLSKFQPVKVLKKAGSTRPGKLGMRKVLSAAQFVISAFFIITSILLYNQFRHFMRFEYGFNAGGIVNVALQGNDYRTVAAELGSVPGVSAVSACDIVPATGRSNTLSVKKVGSREEPENFSLLQADENFAPNLGLTLLAGRNLPAAGTASGRAVVINQSAVRELGYQYPSEAVGQVLELGNKETVEVIGVVDDFRYRLLLTQEAVGPLVMQHEPGSFKYVNVKIAPGDPAGTVAALQARWKEIDAVHPLRYEFFDRQLAATHRGILDVVSVLGFLALLAIIIACLGMLGMATYTAERRTKEVGIRKVLGAADLSIALLLSREFLKVLAVSILIAAPVSYLLNNVWLQHFPNRVAFGFGTVLLGSLLLLVLGLVTIASQTLRASRRKPVDSLRIE